MNPADDIAGVVEQDENAGPLNCSKAKEQTRVGLDEIAEQTEQHVGDHEEFEGVAGE